MKKVTLCILIFLILIFAFAGFSAFKYILPRYTNTVNYSSTYFLLKNSTSFDQTAVMLEEKKVIRSATFFRYYTKLCGINVDNFSSGNYIIKPNTTLKDLINKLRSGKSDFAIVTIPEGYSLNQIADRLEKNNLIKKDDFLNISIESIDYDKLISPSKDVFYSMEGYLFPDTYYIPYDSSKEKIAQLMYESFSKVFSEKYRQRAKELGLTVNEVITIASLIEKEAANDQERSKIAGVIYNRLKKGMKLEIDAAVIYANTKGEKNISKVTYSHLRYDSKYNTYLYKELPPGPIASPGKPSIEAALYPEAHDYLYYVLSPNGHVFSKTYEEHLENVKKYIK